jgi:retinol dehydrogenase-12
MPTGHYYFTKLLLPTMIATAKTTPDGKTRIVTTSSSGHHFGRLDFDTFKDSPERRKRGSNALYCQSKFVRPETLSRSTESDAT